MVEDEVIVDCKEILDGIRGGEQMKSEDVATLEKGFDILHSNESDHLGSEISEDYISIMLNLATYYEEVEQFEKSITYLQKMYSFAVEDNKILFAKISLHFQANIFASNEDFENLEITCQLHDSLNDGEDDIMDAYKAVYLLEN